jgi:hypothetical protein
MALYKHPFFTINLTKVIAVYQTEDGASVVIQTDDQKKIEVNTGSPEAAVEFLSEFAGYWEMAAGPLLRHGRHVILSSAIYSIQAAGDQLEINFRDYSTTFVVGDPAQTLTALDELTRRWQEAIGGTPGA